MPINVIGNSSKSFEHKLDTKTYPRTKYLESNIEEDIDLKNQFRIPNLLDPISIREACSKNYVDNKFNDPSIKKTQLMLTLTIKISRMFVLFK